MGMGVFEDSYKQLNAAQKQAVDTIDGAVLVVAGPGTGKTQLLSMRVANILRKTDTDPSSILCLTFTNKAATNMRERLLQLTGGEARDVNVKTFHSFAAEIMNMYPDCFWNGAKLSTAPDTTQIEIIQDILSKLPLNNPLALRFAGQFTAGRDVKAALKYAKEAGLTPKKLEAIIKANLAYLDAIEEVLVNILSTPLKYKDLTQLQSKINELPNQGLTQALEPLQDLGQTIKDSLAAAAQLDDGTNKTKNTGKWKARWVQSVDGKKGMFKERERNKWWLSLAGVYESYRNSLHQRGYYDYSDMIVEVISQLQANNSVRADAQEKFLYVLIDEFQDTNAAQLQFANIIADHPSANGNPNIMAVGDDDQSIYKFNGAELNNMLSFRRTYPQTTTIVLTENYRSSQAILDASAKIINLAKDRLVIRQPDLNKHIVAVNPPEAKGDIHHISFPTEEHELSHIAESISKNYHAGQTEVGVLARDHASLRRLASLLTKLGIPLSYEQQNNILEHPAVIQIHLIDSLLVAIKNGDRQTINYLLVQTLRSPMWQISPNTLWKLAIDNYRSDDWFSYLLKSKDTKLQNIGQWILWLSAQIDNEPLPIIIEYVIGLRAGEHLTSPLREHYLANTKVDTEYLQALSAVRLLQAMVNDFSRRSNADLEDLVNFMQLNYDTNEIIADESIFVTGSNAVELLTVHKAKGLEFDTVYIINAVDNNWKPNAGGRKSPANLPLQPAGDDPDDYARLMFVAATRAKRQLIAASYREDVNGKDVMSTPLLVDAMPLKVFETTDRPDLQILEEHLSWPHLNIHDEKLNLRNQLDNFSLSVSAMLDFLDVTKGGPEYFFEKYLLSLPEAKTSSMAFGTAIHSALEFAQISVNSDNLVTSQVLERYEQALGEQWLATNDYQRFLDHGKELLSKLLKNQTFWLGKGDLPEQRLSDVRLGNAQLNGMLDRVNVKDDTIIIIDYKTGKPLGSLTTRDQTKVIKAWRQRSQIIFYTLLLKNSSRFKAKQIKGQMWYVEAAAANELIREYIPTQAELDRMAQLIQAIWPKIKELNLPIITNYAADYSGIQAFEQDLIDGKI